MKNFFLALVMFSSALIVNAQDAFVEHQLTTMNFGDGATGSSSSQSDKGLFLKSKVELGGQFALSGTKYDEDDEAITLFVLQPYVGIMLYKGLELGVYPGLSSISGGSLSRTEYQIFLAPAYNFDAGNTYPFIEGLVGYSSSDIGLSGMGFGGRTGFKIQIGNSSLVSLGFSYVRQNLKSTNDQRYAENFGAYMFEVGFRVFL